LNGTNAIFICGNIYQNTGINFVAGATYTLSIQVGRPTGAPAPGANGMSFGFATAAGTAWESGTSTAPFISFINTPSGSMTTYTFSYTALASDAGNPIVIRLDDYSDNSNPTRSAANGDYALDNVTLNVAQIVNFTPAVPTFSSPNATNNQFSFQLTGTTGANYVVQATTNLNPANWIPLVTNPAPFLFTDTNANSFGQRFYRITTP
jgi:hypothetical protein